MLRSRSVTRRVQFIALGVVVSTLTLIFLLTSSTFEFLSSLVPGTRYKHDIEVSRRPPEPPTWNSLREWEASLPQHNLDLPFPEGKEGRYLKFSNQVQQLGWNNVLNELLMDAYLAYTSNRTYVFQEYIWKQEYYTWPKSTWRTYPPRTPLNALISGPAAGGPFDPNDPSPRAVSVDFFDVVCPHNKRKYIYTQDIKPKIEWAPGIEIFTVWANILKDEPAECVEIIPADRSIDNFPQTFDLWLWGTERILSLWEPFTHSPISRLFETSPIVESAIEANKYLFFPRGPQLPVSGGAKDSDSSWPRNPFSHVMAVHIRRGDYKEACERLAFYNSTFYSWNLLPQLPDPFNVPPSMTWNTDEYNKFYHDRCFPEPEAIVKKIRDSRDGQDLLFLLTNAKGEWLARLKRLLKEDGWDTIVTGNELVLNAEQTDVNMAIDMDIARRAGVFIGNGWSSFTSNIVHRRLVDGKKPTSTRFW